MTIGRASVAAQRKRAWGRGRTAIVPVRFSEEEKRLLQGRADAAGLALSALIRATALHEHRSRAPALTRTSVLTLRHRLRRVHTGLQQALLRAPATAGAEYQRRAMELLGDIIREIH